jgi:Spy/CpxP family protein refolding chaperone
MKETRMRTWIIGFLASAAVIAAAASTESPYVGEEQRAIKALSQQQIDDYLQGRGLGYGKAAELNHYPGPLHVLDLAEELELTPDQVSRSKAIFAAMQAQAVALGKQIVEREQALDRAFADGAIEADSLESMVSDLGTLQARIRYTHLVAHLEQRAVLTGHQVQLYDRLRGYGAGQVHQHDHAH